MDAVALPCICTGQAKGLIGNIWVAVHRLCEIFYRPDHINFQWLAKVPPQKPSAPQNY